MKAADATAPLKAHLAKRGFGNVEVNVTSGYDVELNGIEPTTS